MEDVIWITSLIVKCFVFYFDFFCRLGKKILTLQSQKRKRDSVAQLVEQMTLNHWVEGSSPSGVTEIGAFSSAGLEHLPYKQRVGGSNPSTPTRKSVRMIRN